MSCACMRKSIYVPWFISLKFFRWDPFSTFSRSGLHILRRLHNLFDWILFLFQWSASSNLPYYYYLCWKGDFQRSIHKEWFLEPRYQSWELIHWIPSSTQEARTSCFPNWFSLRLCLYWCQKYRNQLLWLRYPVDRAPFILLSVIPNGLDRKDFSAKCSNTWGLYVWFSYDGNIQLLKIIITLLL